MPSPVRPPRLQPVDQSTEQLVLKQTYLGAQINLYADGAPIAQRVVDVLVMDWTIVGKTANFGDVTSDGRPFWTGDFSGSGQDQILFHFPGESNWWLGAFAQARLAWSNAGNTANLGNLADGRPFWTGKFSRATQTDLLFYSPSSFTWTLGQFNDGTFRWNEVSDTSNFGNLADGRPFWVGRFSGTGRDDMLFYFPSDGNWWLGTLTQNQLNWTLAGNTADMGVLQDGRPFWTGSFSRPDHTDLVLYSPSDQNWFLGQFDGATMTWIQAANTSNLGDLVNGRPFFTGNFSRAGQTDLLSYSPADQNWLLGTFNQTQLSWAEAGNASRFGDLADGRPFWVAPFNGTGRDDVLFYFPGDSNWWLGSFSAPQFNWSQVSNTRGLGNFTDGRRIWTGRFANPRKGALLTYTSSDMNWRLGECDGVGLSVPRKFAPGENLTASQEVEGSTSDLSAAERVRHSYATQGYDVSRGGWNPRETALTPASVKASLRLLFNQPVDGQILAQPLYAENLQLVDGTRHNVVFVATEANSVYAFDADTSSGAAAQPLWQAQLTPNGESPVQGKADLDGCDNIDPLVGITATPVIDAANCTLYVLAKSRSNGAFHYRLHALDLASGADQAASPLEIQLDNFDPQWENNRAALLLSGGRLFLAFGAHCDRGLYHGWILSYEARFLSQLAAFNCSPDSGTPDTGYSGIWQCGIGLSADEDGNVFCTTGNGVFTGAAGGRDYGNSVLKLSPDLALIDYFTPFNQANLNSYDWDLGSGGLVLLPEQATAAHRRLAVACGKQGVIYVLDRGGNMGKYNGPGGPDLVVQSVALYPDRVPVGPGRPSGSDASTPGVYGAPGYYSGPDGPRLFYCGSNGPVKAFTLENGVLSPQTLQTGGPLNQSSESYLGQVDESGTPSAAGGCTPVVSSNADAPGTAVVWAVTRHGPQLLRAYDVEDLTTTLFEGQAGAWNNVHGSPFTVPTVIGGKVYVGTADHLAVFGT